LRFAHKNKDGELEPIIGHTEHAWIVLAKGSASIRVFGGECCALTRERWEELVMANSAAVPR
jgi:hypothetical protein